MLTRLRASLRTNEPQATMVCLFTALNLLACVKRGVGATPWWLWLGAGTFWPIVALVINLINPLPVRRRPPTDGQE